MFLIKYLFGGKTIKYEARSEKEKDTFLRYLGNLNIKLLSVQFLLFQEEG